MKNVYEFPPLERRYDEASQWIARLDRQLTSEEARALQKWMAADPENEALLMEMARLWDKMDALGRLSSLFQPPVEKPGRVRLLAFASLATLAVAVVALWLVWSHAPTPYPAPTEYVYQTGVGENTVVTLPDGTGLILNTNSRISVRYTDRYRLFTLERGEVYVKVAKDKSRPLRVMAGGKYVQAVGTEFNVKITSNQQIELVVVEGKVKVGVHNQAMLVAEPDKAEEPPQSTQPLVAGQAVVLGGADEEVEEVSIEDIKVKLSWRQGNIVFRGESLEDAVREVERYTPVEFVFLDQDLKKIRVAGLFKAGDVDGLLATLRENFNIVYEQTDENKVLLKAH